MSASKWPSMQRVTPLKLARRRHGRFVALNPLSLRMARISTASIRLHGCSRAPCQRRACDREMPVALGPHTSAERCCFYFYYYYAVLYALLPPPASVYVFLQSIEACFLCNTVALRRRGNRRSRGRAEGAESAEDPQWAQSSTLLAPGLAHQVPASTRGWHLGCSLSRSITKTPLHSRCSKTEIENR